MWMHFDVDAFRVFTLLKELYI